MANHRILLIALFVMQSACSSAPPQPAPTEMLAPCGSLPNCVNSFSGKGGQAVEPLRATASQWTGLKLWLHEQKNWHITVDDGLFLQAVAITPTMRFRDDVQLLFQPDARTIQVRSSSRLGIGDMGANRRRVERLRSTLSEMQP